MLQVSVISKAQNAYEYESLYVKLRDLCYQYLI